MADKIRIGIVGATVTQGGSGWGANAHVPALSILPDYELKAVCTAHADTAQASKEKFGAALAEMQTPDKYTLVPEATPPGPPRNVAQTYRRAADAFGADVGFEVDFDLAVTRHKLIDMIERSSGG